MLGAGEASAPAESLSELRIAVHRLWLSRLRSGMRTATVSPQLRWLSESTGFFLNENHFVKNFGVRLVILLALFYK